MEERFIHIDIAKGFAIILMVLAHSLVNSPCERLISLFHMPLFFIVSGFCFNDKYLTDIKLFIKRKFTGIIIPYFCAVLFFNLSHNLLWRIGFVGSCNDIKSIVGAIIAFLFSLDVNYEMLWQLWFLKQLFLANLIFYAFRLYLKDYSLVCLLLVLAIAYSVYLSDICNIFGPHYNTFIYAGYLAIGVMIRRNYDLLCHIRFFLLLILALILAVLGYVFFPYSCLGCPTYAIIPYIIISVVISVFCIRCAQKISSLKIGLILSFVGKHTLSILILHILLFRVISSCIVYLYNLPLSKIIDFPIITEFSSSGWWAVYTSVGIVVPIFLEVSAITIKQSFTYHLFQNER